MAKAKFERNKPHCNVGTIGHVDHGKNNADRSADGRSRTTVAGRRPRSLMTKLRRRPKARADATRRRCLTIATSHVEYATPNRHYAHVDCPGHADYVQEHDHGRCADGWRNPRRLGVDGPMPQTREHILLARQVGVPQIVVFLNKCDIVEDEELLDLVEMEVRELLVKYNFPGDDTPVIRGAAVKALNGGKGSAR